MESKIHNRIDVKVYEEILKGMYRYDIFQNMTKNERQEEILKANSYKLNFECYEEEVQKILSVFPYEEYGFRNKSDVKTHLKTDIIERITTLSLTPTSTYEPDDCMDIPNSNNEITAQYYSFMADSFERIRIKAENVLETLDDKSKIEFYAKKNIEKARSIFYQARKRIENMKYYENTEFAIIYCLSVYIMHTITLYQKLFKEFGMYKTETLEKLKFDLLNSISFKKLNEFIKPKQEILEEPMVDYGETDKTDQVEKIIWTGQINTLITLFYDLKNSSPQVIEISNKAITELICNYFVDKNGKPINKLTVKTTLCDSREDKRAKGDKRIDISKYLE